MTVDLSKAVFSSSANYLARSNTATGSTILTLPAFGLTVTATITHSLGYIPFFEVFADIDNNGTIWYGNKINHYTETSLGGVYASNPILKAWSTTTQLKILLDNSTSPTATGSRTVYWILYLDYGGA